MPKIGKRTVDAAKPMKDRFIIWDDTLKGFGLLVLPSGIKSYLYQYRNKYGVKRRYTIGKHAGSLTPDQARKRAEELQLTVRDGGDPLGERRELRDASTVNDLLDRYLQSEAFKEKATSTQGIDRGRIDRHLRPTLGAKYADSLTTESVKRAMAAIRDGKTSADVKTRKRGRARVTGGEGTARMAIGLLRAIFSWAVEEKLAKSNPCVGVKLGTSGTRETILEDADDYARLFETLARMENEKRLRSSVADAITLIAYTGMRRGEAAGLKWAHVDLRKGTLTLPIRAHKTGRRTGKPKVIDLPAMAQAIVARQAKGETDDYVFRPARGDGPISLSKPWRMVRTEAKLPEGIGLHGLRHSIGSSLAMDGAQAAEIMTALGHRQLSTTQRYIHFANKARQGLAERAAKVALAGMTAANGEKEPETTPIKAKH